VGILISGWTARASEKLRGFQYLSRFTRSELEHDRLRFPESAVKNLRNAENRFRAHKFPLRADFLHLTLRTLRGLFVL